jgi:YHS domain-containing protein
MAAPAKPAKTIACSVMPTNKVDIAKATKNHMYADYKGNRYFFCCGGCPSAFKKDPAKYAKSAHIKTPKSIKKSA